MKATTLLIFLMFPSSWLFSTGARADEPATERTKFYDFGELGLHGQVAKPTVLYTNAKERATFERLFVLKRSLLPEIVRSADGASLAQPPVTP